MGTAREKKFWDLGLGKALRQRSHSSPARCPHGQALYLPCSLCCSLDVQPQPDASQRVDAEELDQG